MSIKIFFHDAKYEGGNTQNMTIVCDRGFGFGDEFEGDSSSKIREALSEIEEYEVFENTEYDLYIFECKLAYVGADQLARVFNKLSKLSTEFEIDPRF